MNSMRRNDNANMKTNFRNNKKKKASMNKNRKEWTINLAWDILWPRTKENPLQCSVLFSNLIEMTVMLSQGRDDRSNKEDTVEQIMLIEDQYNTEPIKWLETLRNRLA